MDEGAICCLTFSIEQLISRVFLCHLCGSKNSSYLLVSSNIQKQRMAEMFAFFRTLWTLCIIFSAHITFIIIVSIYAEYCIERSFLAIHLIGWKMSCKSFFFGEGKLRNRPDWDWRGNVTHIWPVLFIYSKVVEIIFHILVSVPLGSDHTTSPWPCSYIERLQEPHRLHTKNPLVSA